MFIAQITTWTPLRLSMNLSMVLEVTNICLWLQNMDTLVEVFYKPVYGLRCHQYLSLATDSNMDTLVEDFYKPVYGLKVTNTCLWLQTAT